MPIDYTKFNHAKFARLFAEQGWSMLRFSKKAGLSYGCVINVLRARNRTMLSTAKKCADALGVPVMDLTEFEPYKKMGGDNNGAGNRNSGRSRKA